MKTLILAYLVFFQSFSGLALSSSFAVGSCVITITSELFTGDVRTRTFHAQTQDKKGCEKRARLHGKNFAPQSVKNKTVKFEWRAK